MIESNFSASEIRSAYNHAVQLTGFDFAKKVLADYDEIGNPCEKLRSLGVHLPWDGEGFDGANGLVEMFLAFCKKGHQSLEARVVPDEIEDLCYFRSLGYSLWD